MEYSGHFVESPGNLWKYCGKLEHRQILVCLPLESWDLEYFYSGKRLSFSQALTLRKFQAKLIEFHQYQCLKNVGILIINEIFCCLTMTYLPMHMTAYGRFVLLLI